jgi:hypothetical protein
MQHNAKVENKVEWSKTWLWMNKNDMTWYGGDLNQKQKLA